MARSILLACLLAALVPAASAAEGPSLVDAPVGTGSVSQGTTSSTGYSTHGDQPCLDVYMPRVYTVTLAYSPPGDVLTLSVGELAATGSDGHAVLSFVANYCTAFTVSVKGTSVADSASYAWAVTSLPVVLDGAVLA